MASTSGMDTMRQATEMLERFDIPYEVAIVSAHRTPDRMFRFAVRSDSTDAWHH